MRKVLFTNIIIFLIGILPLQSQITFTTNKNISCAGATSCFDLTAEDFTNMANMQFQITWDPTALDYLSFNDFLPPTSFPNDFDSANGNLLYSWNYSNSFPGNGYDATDGDILMTICFDILNAAGDCSIDFVDGPGLPVEMTSSNFVPVPFTFTTGTTTSDDSVPPSISCPGTMNFTGAAQVVNGIAPTSVTDDCGTPGVTYVLTGATTGSGNDDASGTTFQVGTTTVTYTATDGSNNTDVCSFDIVIDNSNTGGGIIEFNPIIDYDCTTGILTMDLEVVNFDDINSFQFLLEWDPAVIDYIDNTYFFPSTPPSYFFTDMGEGKLPWAWQSASATGSSVNDDVSILTLTFNVVGTLTSPLFTFSDLTTSNPIIVEQNNVVLDPSLYVFNVEELNNSSDITDPSISCPAGMNLTGTAQVVNGIAPTDFSDDCGTPAVTYVLTGATTGSGNDDASGTTFNIGTTTVTYTATDAAGNTDDCAFDIFIDNNTGGAMIEFNPIIDYDCTTGILTMNLEVVNFDDINSFQFLLEWDPTVIDYIDNTYFFPSTPPSYFFTDMGEGKLPWAWQSANATGSSVSNDVSILTMTFNVLGTLSSPLFTFSDLTTTNPIIVEQNNVVLDPSLYVFNVEQNNTTADVTDPSISCPIGMNFTGTAQVVNGIAPTDFSDDCGTPAVTYVLTGATTGSGNDDASGTTFNVGTTTVTYTATDAAGNIDDCAFDIFIDNNVTPGDVVEFNPVIEYDCNTDILTVNLEVVNFENINSFQFLLEWDESIIEFIETTYFLPATPPSEFFTDMGEGKIPWAWQSANATGTNVNDDVSILTLTFNVVGNLNSPLFTFSDLTTTNPIIVEQNNVVLDPSLYAFNVETFSITNDTEAPTFGTSCPSDIGVNVDTGTCGANVSWTEPTATDECDPTNVTVTNMSGFTSGDNFPLGSSTVTYMATDGTGNQSTCSFIITVTDNVDPTISCPAGFSQNSDAGVCTAVINGIDPTSSDNCGIASTTYTLTGATTASGNGSASGLTFNPGITTVTYTVADAAGNSVSCSFDIEVIASGGSGTISCPSTTVVTAATGDCDAVVNNIDLVFDPCLNLDITYSITYGALVTTGTGSVSGLTFGEGISAVTYNYTNLDDNQMGSCTFQIQVLDQEDPVPTCPDNVTVNADDGKCSALVDNINVTATDNCGIITTATSYVFTGPMNGSGTGDASGTIFMAGITTITYTVTDVMGNMADCSFTVEVIDNEDPVVTCPMDVAVAASSSNCTAIVNDIEPSLSDNCGIQSIVYTTTGATNISGTIDASGFEYNPGTTVVTYTVTDFSNNSASCSFNIVVSDTEDPTITCLMPDAFSTDPGQCDVVVNNNIDPVVNDNCDNNLDISYIITNNSVQIGSGNGSAIGTTFPIGTSTITYTVTDDNNNTATCTSTVVVADNENPTIDCPSDITQLLGANVTCGIVNGIEPTSSNDNCGIASITYTLTGATSGSGFSDASGTCFNAGTTTVTYTATDDNGNVSSCSFLVIMNTADAPGITCPSNVSMDNDAGLCSANVSAFDVTINSDPTDVALISWELTGATTGMGTNTIPAMDYNAGTTNITFTVLNMAGASATCSFEVVVNDNEAPTVNCPNNVITSMDTDQCDAVVMDLDPQTVDNCGTVNCTYTLTGGTNTTGSGSATGLTFGAGVTIVTYTCEDDNSNSNDCTFTVLVEDNEAPSLDCPDNFVTTLSTGQTAATLSFSPDNLSDNCPGLGLAWDITGASIGSGAGNVVNFGFNPGTSTVCFTATDGSSNPLTCCFDVTVNTDNPPMIQCPANISTTAAAGLCNTTVDNINVFITDPGDVASIEYTLSGATTGMGTGDASGETFNVGVTNVTYTVTGTSGAIATCSFTVTVTDLENPVVTCPQNITVNTDPDLCTADISDFGLLTSDNCGVSAIDYILSGATTGSGAVTPIAVTFELGVTTVSIMVTDDSGNTADCIFGVEVIDNQAPSISCPMDVTVTLPNGDPCIVVNNLGPVSSSDNCTGILPPSFNMTGANNSVGAGDVSGTCFNLGVTTVTYTISDGNGNSADCSFMVTVNSDQTPDIIDCPDDVVIYAPADTCFAQAMGISPTILIPISEITALSYNITGALTLSGPNSPDGLYFPVGESIVTVFAQSIASEIDSCSFMVTVLDTIAPVWVDCPANIITVADSSASCMTEVTWEGLSAFDACQPLTLDFIYVPGVPAEFPVGTTTVNYTATDPSGNAATCSFDITVTDTLAPIFSNCPQDITLFTSSTSCDSIAIWDEPTVVDNCMLASLVPSHFSGTVFSTGTTIVTYTATDDVGNISTCDFEVRVIDNVAPTLSCPDSVLVDATGLIIDDGGIVLNAVAQDNCTGVLMSFAETTGMDNCAMDTTIVTGFPIDSIFPIGTTVITYTAIDTAGNESNCSVNVIVESGVGQVGISSDVAGGICSGDSINLFVNNPFPGATYTWSGPGVVGNGSIAYVASIDSSATYEVLCELDGGCTAIGSIDFIVTPSPIIEASVNSLGCSDGTDTLYLSADIIAGQITGWNWSGPNDFTAGMQNTFIPNVTADDSGTYIVSAVNAAGCVGTDTVEVGIFNSPGLPEIQTDCNALLCVGEECILLGTDFLPMPSAYNWDGPFITSTTDQNSVVIMPTASGTFVYNYSVSFGDCTSEVAQIAITVAGAPEANDDQFSTPVDVLLDDFDVLDNDSNSSDVTITVLTNVTNGSLTNNGDGTFDYTPDNAFVGEDFFIYEICDDCNGECDQATVIIIVDGDVNCDEIPNYLSPNDDGTNDELVIPCLEFSDFPNNEMVILNEWGDEVYRQSPYGNGVYWNGTFQANGEDAPDGTYFYILYLDDQVVRRGFITLFR